MELISTSFELDRAAKIYIDINYMLNGVRYKWNNTQQNIHKHRHRKWKRENYELHRYI